MHAKRRAISPLDSTSRQRKIERSTRSCRVCSGNSNCDTPGLIAILVLALISLWRRTRLWRKTITASLYCRPILSSGRKSHTYTSRASTTGFTLVRVVCENFSSASRTNDAALQQSRLPPDKSRYRKLESTCPITAFIGTLRIE